MVFHLLCRSKSRTSRLDTYIDTKQWMDLLSTLEINNDRHMSADMILKIKPINNKNTEHRGYYEINNSLGKVPHQKNKVSIRGSNTSQNESPYTRSQECLHPSTDFIPKIIDLVSTKFNSRKIGQSRRCYQKNF